MKIFHNANIYTPQHMAATAMVVDHDRFSAIGSDVDILDGFNDAKQIFDLKGLTVWPGLTDAHVHLRHLAESMTMVDCETKTLGECLSRVKNTAKELPQESWLRGHGWNQNSWIKGFGNAGMLDAVSANHPAYLTAKSLHAAWANSQALALAGIDAHTPDPPNGIIQRDDSGQPTGILLEAGAMSLVESVIPKPTHAELVTKFCALWPELQKLGLVSVHDFDGFDCWQVLQDCYQNSKLNIRVRKNIPFDHLDAFIHSGLRTDFGDDWLHLGGLKLFADGALGPQTAAMQKPYESSNGCGTLLMNEEEILTIGKRAVINGFALAVHAIGDRANHIVLNAFEKLRAFEQTQELFHLRHRIEHVQIIDPQDLPRLAALDIIASVQPIHAPSDMDMADRYLGDRSGHAYAYQSMLNSGACLVFGSDTPVEPVNPFQGIHAAVTRRRLDGSPGKNGWHPDQRLSLEDTLDGFSRKPAEIAGLGRKLGQIAPGFKADFLILNDDPFKLETHELGKIKPAATFIDGKCVFQSNDLHYEF